MRTPLLATAAMLPSFVVATKAVYSLPLLFYGVASFGRVWDVTLGGLVASAAPARQRRGVLGLYAALVLISAALTSAPVRARPVLDATAALRGIWRRMPPGAEWRLFDPVGGKQFRSSCDMARQTLIGLSVNYEQSSAPAGTPAVVKIGDKSVPAFAGAALDDKAFAAQKAVFVKAVTDGVRGAGYPASADPTKTDMPLLIACLIYLAILVTMVYGPIAAALVELFPTRIRYTAMSLPYHIGNGWFGGLLPPIVVAIVAASGNILAGLWYPIIIAGMTFVIGMLFVPETRKRDIYND
jgi:hypothetical protein